MTTIQDQNFLKYLDEPLMTTYTKPKKFGKDPWRDLNIPQALIVVGDKRSGKDVVLDNELIILYKKWFTCIKIFDGGGHESLYYAVTKNCKAKWQMINQILDVFWKLDSSILKIQQVKELTSIDPEIIHRLLKVMEAHQMIKTGQKEMGLLENGMKERNNELLHCNCDTAYPITVMHPTWIKPNKKQVEQFNGIYWDGFWEYNEAYQKCLVNEYLPPEINFKEIRKPKELIAKINPLIEFVEHPIPLNSNTKIQEFHDIFCKTVLDCRERHRICIGLSTAFYPDTSEGKTAKYHVFGEEVYSIKPIADQHFIPKRNQETPKDKAWHKIGLFVPELWKPVPDNQMSPEPEASFSKRAFLAFMPTSRHAKTWVRVNSQSIGDVLKKSNKQQDLIIIKRSSDRNLGEELGWFKTKIQKEIEKALVKSGFWSVENGKIQKTPMIQPIKNFLLDHEKLSEIAALPDDRGYVINGNGEHILEKWDLPPNHHKADAENFTGDTGISFKFDDRFFYENPIKKSFGSGKTKSEKETRKKVLEYVHELHTKNGMQFTQIYDKLIQEFGSDSDEKKFLQNIQRHTLGHAYRRYYSSVKN